MLTLDLLYASHRFNQAKPAPLKTSISINDGIPPTFWYELKHLISVTPSDYEKLYVKPMQLLCHHLKNTSSANDISALIKPVLTLIIAALKIRRAHMLPVGTDAETCYQQQDAWTYALFTVILFRQFVQTNSDALQQINQWLPATGLNWLKQYSTLFSEWQDSLSSSTVNSSLNAIIYQAVQPTSNKPIQANKENKNLTDTFINWLNRAIARRQLTINTAEAFIHRVEKGMLLKMPEIYLAFINTNKSIKTFIQDKNESEAIDLLTQDNRFIPTTARTGFLHTYYWNEWKDRQIISGLLLASDVLFTPDTLPPCNEQLHPESLRE